MRKKISINNYPWYYCPTTGLLYESEDSKNGISISYNGWTQQEKAQIIDQIKFRLK